MKKKSANTFSVYWWSLDRLIHFRTSLARMNCWCYFGKPNIFNSSICTKHKIGVPSFSVNKGFPLSHWLVISCRTAFSYTSKQKHLCHNHSHDLRKYVIRSVKLLKMMIKNCLVEATSACVQESKKFRKAKEQNSSEIILEKFDVLLSLGSSLILQKCPFSLGRFFL